MGPLYFFGMVEGGRERGARALKQLLSTQQDKLFSTEREIDLAGMAGANSQRKRQVREGHCRECGKRTYRDHPCQNTRCSTRAPAHLKRHATRIRENLAAFDGEVRMITITAPGSVKLPWKDGVVDPAAAWRWNAGCFRRWRSLREASRKVAERKCKGAGARWRTPVLVVVPELQKRGVFHLHVVIGAETPADRLAGDFFAKAIRANDVSHGFGYSTDKGRWSGSGAEASGYVSKLAKYLSKGQGLLGAFEAGEVPARAFYVARRLTSRTGLTMRALRRRSEWWGAHRQWLSNVDLKWLLEAEEALGRRLSVPQPMSAAAPAAP